MSEDNISIKVSNVSKQFLLPHQKASTLKSVFVNPFNKFENEKQLALSDISFEVEKGDFFGIVGRNGSGKSTLLKCIAKVYTPDEGSIKVHGSLVPFIELGVGFNPELSGRDNVYLNGSLLGFSREQVTDMYDKIVSFAEIEKFMDQKLKNYSSGMQVRLAFSIAIQAKSEILLLDEVLAVGDTEFQQKCFSYFEQIRSEKRTVLLVSHDMGALRRFCNKGVLIDEGSIISEGPIDIVLDDYADRIKGNKTSVSRHSASNNGDKIGSGQAKIAGISTTDGRGNTKKIFSGSDTNILVSFECVAIQDIKSPVYGITIKDKTGATVFSSNTLRRNVATKDLLRDKKQNLVWEIPNIFNTGELSISAAVTDENGKKIYDRADGIATFEVEKKLSSTALVNPDHSIKLVS